MTTIEAKLAEIELEYWGARGFQVKLESCGHIPALVKALRRAIEYVKHARRAEAEYEIAQILTGENK